MPVNKGHFLAPDSSLWLTIERLSSMYCSRTNWFLLFWIDFWIHWIDFIHHWISGFSWLSKLTSKGRFGINFLTIFLPFTRNISTIITQYYYRNDLKIEVIYHFKIRHISHSIQFEIEQNIRNILFCSDLIIAKNNYFVKSLL